MQKEQLNAMLDKHKAGRPLSPRRYNTLEIYQQIQAWPSALNPTEEAELKGIEEEIKSERQIDPRKLKKRKDLLKMKFNPQLMASEEQEAFYAMR